MTHNLVATVVPCPDNGFPAAAATAAGPGLTHERRAVRRARECCVDGWFFWLDALRSAASVGMDEAGFLSRLTDCSNVHNSAVQANRDCVTPHTTWTGITADIELRSSQSAHLNGNGTTGHGQAAASLVAEKFICSVSGENMDKSQKRI